MRNTYDGTKIQQLRNGDYLEVPGFSELFIEGSGGGCLTGDTWVSTPTGSKLLSELRPGDEVLCYEEGDTNSAPRNGQVVYTHRHDAESTRDNLLHIKHERGVLKITSRHFIADITGNFREAKTFKIGDYLITSNGQLSRILSIITNDLAEDTYTIDVEPFPTFIGNGIRVHNGGGGKKKPYKPKTDKVNLQSNAIASFILMYSEGETGGLIDGAKSIYFDETPLMDDAGILQFQGVQWEERFGLPDQNYVVGFEQSANTRSINTEVLFGSSVIRTVTNANVDAARVVISIPRLGQLTDKGDRLGTSVQLQFDVRDPVAGIWENRGTRTITGRTQEVYQIGFRLEKPTTTIDEPWEIRVSRLTLNAADPDKLFNQTNWSDLVELLDGKESYPNCAYIAMKIDASLFGGKVPKVSLGVKGIKVKVPSNYNQTNINAPSYSGVWDGTWKWEVTPNPIWHIYNFIINTRYGMGVNEGYINRYAFYTMARYCDAVGADGAFVGVDDIQVGTKRRRFTVNTQITKQDDAMALLNTIASSARGMNYFGGGTLIPVQDAPKDTSWRFTNSDVEGGRFKITSAELKDAINVANIKYNDPTDHFRPSIESYPTPENQGADPVIQEYGRIEYNAFKYGCTSRAEARSFAKWVVTTSQKEYKMIEFTTGLNGALVRPGDIIEVYDRNVAGVSFGGRILGGTTSSIQLDRPITLTNGVTYKISVMKADGSSYEERTVTNAPGETSTITLSTALTTSPTDYFGWYVTGEGEVEPTKWRVLWVKEDGLMKYQIFGLFYYEGKFAEVETGLVFTDPVYTKTNLKDIAPVSNIQFSVYSEKNEQTQVSTNTLLVTWTKSPSDYVLGYQIYYSYNNETFRDMGTTLLPEIRIPNVQPGEHDITIYAYNAAGAYSTGVNDTYNYVFGNDSIFLPPSNLYVYGTTGYDFTGPDLVFSWEANAANNNLQGSVFKDYQVEIWTSDGATLLRREWTDLTYYNYDKTKNTQDGLHRSVLVKVYTRDTNNLISASPASHVFTNAAPVAPVFDVIPGYGQAWVKITPPSDTDLAGYVVCMGTTSNFTPSAGNIVYSGPDNYCSFNVGTAATYYFKVAAYDLFDNTFGSLQFGSASSAVIFDASQLSQVTVEGITLKGNDPTSNKVSWTAGKVLYSLGGGSVTTYNITASNATWSTGTLYVFWDKDNNPTTFQTTTDIANTVGRDKRIIGIYRGGIDLVANLGKAFLDGSLIYAGTIAAAQLVTGTAVITQTAQIADSIITSAHIQNAAITNAKIADASITSAKIQNAAINTAHIVDLSVDTLKIKGGAVSATGGAGGGNVAVGGAATNTVAFVMGNYGYAAICQFLGTMLANGQNHQNTDPFLGVNIWMNGTLLYSRAHNMPCDGVFAEQLLVGGGESSWWTTVYIPRFSGTFSGSFIFGTTNGNNTYLMQNWVSQYGRTISGQVLWVTELKR